MNMVDIRGFRVVYDAKVLNALCIDQMFCADGDFPKIGINKPDRLAVVAIGPDGEVVIIEDEARKFQFIPKLN